MRKLLLASAVFALAVALAGCETLRQDRVLTGALIGGGTGAVIGGVAARSAGGALAGGLIGAAAGGLIADVTRPRYYYYHHHRYYHRRCYIRTRSGRLHRTYC